MRRCGQRRTPLLALETAGALYTKYRFRALVLRSGTNRNPPTTDVDHLSRTSAPEHNDRPFERQHLARCSLAALRRKPVVSVRAFSKGCVASSRLMMALNLLSFGLRLDVRARTQIGLAYGERGVWHVIGPAIDCVGYICSASSSNTGLVDRRVRTIAKKST